MTAAPVLKSITTETKDGEWGKGEPFESSVEMAVIRGTDFERVRMGDVSDLPIRYIPERIASRKTLRAYDILIETAGGSKDRPTGRTMFVKPSLIAKSELPLTCASFARFIRIDPFKADPSYVFWLLQYLYCAGFIKQYHTQHTGVARFQFTTFAERELLRLPPKSIQNRIASILSAYDDLIENNNRRIKILEEMAQVIYREWFVDFRFPGHETTQIMESQAGLIPSGWQVKRIAEIASVKGGKRLARGKVVLDSPTEHPYLRVKDMGECGVDLTDIKYIDEETHRPISRYVITNREIYISIAGTIGRVGIVPKRISGANLTENAAKISDVRGINKYLLLSYLRSPAGQHQIASKVVGTSQPKLALFRIGEIQVPVPPENLQQLVTPLLSCVHEQTETLQWKNVVLRLTRDLLLPKLVSGEIGVEATERETIAQGV